MASRKKASVAVAEVVEPRPVPAAVEFGKLSDAWLERDAVWLSLLLVLIASARIVATYGALSHTFDEPAHIACGMEWLDKGTFLYEAQHPPLPRIMTAIVPWLTGSRSEGQKSMWDEGLAILFKSGTEERTLALARLGVLPFFWITCWVVFAGTRWVSGSRAAAVMAVLLVSLTPSILAHSGLATTDMGLAAMLLLCVYAGWRWMDTPSLLLAAAFGCSMALAILAKLSTLALLPAVAVMGLLSWAAWDRPGTARVLTLLRARAPQAVVVVTVMALTLWAGYRFSFGKAGMFSFRVPAPELFDGVTQVSQHNASGHLSYMLGAVSTVGWPSFYLVALGVKLPLTLIVLGLFGLVLLYRRGKLGDKGCMVGSTVLGILIVASLFAQIRIGTRHILPVVAAMAMAGGVAATWGLRRETAQGMWQVGVGILLLAMLVSSVRAHPNYLAYFNVIAGDKPQDFLVDSDLDWGQDVKRLSVRLKELGAQEVYYNQFQPGDLRKMFGFPPIRPLEFTGPKPGWNAVSLTPMKYGLFGDVRYAYERGVEFWPDQLTPNERIGSSILLFYQPPALQ